jgi:hypothetical protein
MSDVFGTEGFEAQRRLWLAGCGVAEPRAARDQARARSQEGGLDVLAYGCLTVLTPILGLLILLQAVQAADGTDCALWLGLFVVIGLSYWRTWKVKFHRRLRRDCLEELARRTA